MAAPPASLKAIKPYLDRGSEIKARDPIVAYHCRLYALQEAMRLRSTVPKEDMVYVLGLMDDLEKEKAGLGDLDDAAAVVENFGQELFLKADDADRAGKSDMRTGKAFLAACHVLEACKQFGELPLDLEEKIKYAKVRFVKIAKATKEGRPVTPPPGTEPPVAADASSDPVGDPDPPPPDYPPPPPPGDAPPSYLSLPEAPPSGRGSYDALPPPPPVPSLPETPSARGSSALPGTPGSSVPPVPPYNFAAPPPLQSGFKPTASQTREAIGLCQSAISALQFRDHETAVSTLSAALGLLCSGAPPPA